MIFEPQKVLHLHKELEKKNPKLHGEFIITEKIDGWYCYIQYVNGVWQTPKSSADRDIPAFEWYARHLNNIGIRLPYNAIIIAEAYIPDTPFHVLNGIFNRSVGNYDCKDVLFSVHDMLPAFTLQHTAYDRLQILSGLLQDITIPHMSIAKTLAISEYDETKWNKLFDTITYNGGEGIILKHAASLYCPGKRNYSLMKMKLEDAFDLLCKEVYWTVGEKGNDNMNLRLQRKNGVEVTVRVGKHADIAKFTAESPVGNIVEVRCMKELEDGTLREPRFSCVRYDKQIFDID